MYRNGKNVKNGIKPAGETNHIAIVLQIGLSVHSTAATCFFSHSRTSLAYLDFFVKYLLNEVVFFSIILVLKTINKFKKKKHNKYTNTYSISQTQETN